MSKRIKSRIYVLATTAFITSAMWLPTVAEAGYRFP